MNRSDSMDYQQRNLTFSEADISVKVIYGLDETVFNLSRFDTVGDLKREICASYQISLENQVLEGWHLEPQSDDNILEYCGMGEEDENYLILYNSSVNNGDSTRTDYFTNMEQLNETGNSPMDDYNGHIFSENAMDIGMNNHHTYNFTNMEQENSIGSSSAVNNDDQVNGNSMNISANDHHTLLESACSYIDKFSNNYGDTPVTFHVSSIEDAIKEITMVPLAKKKILLLYLHHDGNDFSKMFCENLSQRDVTDMLDKFFYLMGYDIDDQFHSALVRALETSHKLSTLSSLVTKKMSAALLIVPIRDTFSLYSCMRGKISQEDFRTTLKNAITYLIDENKQELELMELAGAQESTNAIGSKEYQQIMFDNLGDRDFDCYLKREHELLKQKIGYSLYGPPNSENTDNGYDKKQNKQINMLYKVICSENYESEKGFIVMKTIFNCTEPLPADKCKRAKKYTDYNPYVDVQPYAIFVVRKCRPHVGSCRVFIDHNGRVYSSWSEYINRNKLPKCEMVLPKDGCYTCDDRGQVLIEKHLSPTCDITSKILDITDVSSTVIGLSSTGIMAVSLIPTVAVAPAALIVAGVAGLGVGAYAIGRSAYALYDKNRHKESMSFADSEARGAYLNILAGSLGFVGAGANVCLTQLAARGMNIGTTVTTAVNGINFMNITASGVSVVNSGYDVVNQWINENQRPSALTLLQLSSSILFFGHAVYNFKPAAVMVQEAQNGVLGEYQASLRSNRHRKTFNKLLRETIKNNNGDVKKGQSQVIKAIRNIQNKDEVFATLTRNNKIMNKNGIKYSIDEGQITLNGHPIDIHEFSSMNKPDAVEFFSHLPNAPEPTPAELNDIKIKLTSNNTFSNINITDGLQLYANAFKFCDGDLKEKLLQLTSKMIAVMLTENFDVLNKIPSLSSSSRLFAVCNIVMRFFEKRAVLLEEQYENWVQTGDPQYDSPLFHIPYVDMSTAPKRFVKFFSYVVDLAFCGKVIVAAIIKDLLGFAYEWIAMKLCSSEEQTDSSASRSEPTEDMTPVSCTSCGGFYYKIKK